MTNVWVKLQLRSSFPKCLTHSHNCKYRTHFDPRHMFDFASRQITGIEFFFFVSNNDVETNSTRFDLGRRFEAAKTVAGTRSHNGFIPTSQHAMKMKRVSNDEAFPMVTLVEDIGSFAGIRKIYPMKQLTEAKFNQGNMSPVFMIMTGLLVMLLSGQTKNVTF